MYGEESFVSCLGMRNLLRGSRNGLTKGVVQLCRYVIHWGRIFYFLNAMLRTLRKNLLLPYQGCFQVYLIYWGRIFCFLTGDCLSMLGSIGEESSTSTMGMMSKICLIRQGRIFCFLTGIVFLTLCDLPEMVLGCTCLIEGGRVFYFLYYSLGNP